MLAPPLYRPRAFRHSTHAIGVAEAIELGRALGQLPPCLIVYGIEGRDFTAGAQLSLEVESSLPGVVVRLLDEVKGIRAQEGYIANGAEVDE